MDDNEGTAQWCEDFSQSAILSRDLKIYSINIESKFSASASLPSRLAFLDLFGRFSSMHQIAAASDCSIHCSFASCHAS